MAAERKKKSGGLQTRKAKLASGDRENAPAANWKKW